MFRTWLDDDLKLAIDNFQVSFNKDLGVSGRGTKKASQKVLARVINENLIPNVTMVMIKQPLKRRVEHEFKLKLY